MYIVHKYKKMIIPGKSICLLLAIALLLCGCAQKPPSAGAESAAVQADTAVSPTDTEPDVPLSGSDPASRSSEPEANAARETERTEPTAEKKSAFVWETDNPENHHMSAEVINDLNRQFEKTEITSSIIVKDGRIVNEYYQDGYGEESTFPVHSCSKSITSAIFGIAGDEGLITDLDEPIADYFPVLNESDSAWKQEITIRHLLTHTSGLRSTEDRWYEWRAASNWQADVLDGPMASEPGTAFDYSTGNTHLLSAILQKAANETLYDYGKAHLFDRIGMESVRCGTDAQGVSDGGNGFILTARDMARFGLLYLNRGKWEDEQIISEDWIDQSTTTQVERYGGSADYGYQWWVRTFGSAQYAAYFAQGHGCQFIFVIPDLDLAVTFTSSCHDNSHAGDYWKYVTEIVESVNQ